jgi:hypothetical protein
MRKLAFMIIILCISASCRQNNKLNEPAPIRTLPAPLATTYKPAGNEVQLKLTELINLEDKNIKITFLAVLEDSRCPTGARCVWEGNGKIKLQVETQNNQSTQVELNTSMEPKSTGISEYNLSLISLLPHPKLNYQINPSEYVATLSLEPQHTEQR